MKIDYKEINIWNVPLGKKNKLLLFIHKYKILSPIKFIVSRILHLELPLNSYNLGIRLPHSYNIIINKRSKLFKNITLYQNVTIGNKQGVLTIKENVIIYSNSVIVGV